MKALFTILALLCTLFGHSAYAQKAHRIPVDGDGNTPPPPAPGELFEGDWEWSAGGETFHITLVRNPAYVSPQFPVAGTMNVIIGQYTYTRNGVLIDQSPNTGPRPYALFCSPIGNRSMSMSFKDNAKGKYAKAILTLSSAPSNTLPNTLTWQIKAVEKMYFDGDVVPSLGFTVPMNVTMTRQ